MLSYLFTNSRLKGTIFRVLMLFLLQDDGSDLWDDTALIKAYDEAVNTMKVSPKLQYSFQSAKLI